MSKERMQKQRGVFGKREQDHGSASERQQVNGISSYVLFEERIKGSITQTREGNYALMCFCVSNLEFINNVFGLTSGNRAVELLGEMLQLHISENQCLTSFAAGNYAVMIRYQKEEEIDNWINELCTQLADYEHVMNTSYSICIHSGIYLIPANCQLPVKDMIDRALIALKLCFGFEKQFVYYDEEMRTKLLLEAEIIKSMDSAIENDEFKIYLQPQHHLQQDDVVLSAEALVRWVKSDGRIIHPGEFIPAFEKNGLIAKLDRHVMELACRFIGAHMTEPWCGNISIAVNVSKVDLKQNDFIKYYTEMKNKYHIPDGLIEVEFTESAVFEDYNEFKGIMTELHKNGFSTALDDFGAGSSSLNVLKELPVDVLKMDRLFFTKEESYDSKRDNSVIASVVAMARGLGMKIIAEGIESVEQIDFLRKIGCDVIQGYVYSKPLPVDDFIEYVKNYKPRFVVKPTVPKGIRRNPTIPDNPDVLYERYRVTLDYVNAFVAEINLEEDSIHIIGCGDETIPIVSSEEKYSAVFEELVSFIARPEDCAELEAKFSLSNLLAAFYRGDDREYLECRGRVADHDTGVLLDVYEWYEFEARFSQFGLDGEKSAQAILFIHNIQKKKEREITFMQREKRLFRLISDIYVTVLEINPKDDVCRIIKDTDDVEIVYERGKDEYSYKAVCDTIFSDMVIHSEDYNALHKMFDPEQLISILNYQDEFRIEYRLLTLDGYAWREARVIRNGDNCDALCCIQDIDHRKKEKYQIADKTLIDRLTKTYNKDGFFEHVSKYLSEGGQSGSHALLVVDFDDFREINQKHGHTFGDMLLCDFVQCMKRINRRDDIIGRVSGDEFVVFIKDINENNLHQKVERIQKLFDSKPGDERYRISFSIGAAVYPAQASDARGLYREAFLALTDAKKCGNGSYKLFTPQMAESAYSLEGGEVLSVTNRPFSDRMFSNVFRIIYQYGTIEDAIPYVLKFIGTQYELGTAFIDEVNDNHEWTTVYSWYNKEQEDGGINNELMELITGNSTVSYAFEQGELFCCNDVDMLQKDLANQFKTKGITAVIVAPIVYEDRVCGLVGFGEDNGSRIWLEDEQETLVLLSDMLASFLYSK